MSLRSSTSTISTASEERLNASASEDKTVFYQTVPSNHLALVLWLESDRMKSLELTRPLSKRPGRSPRGPPCRERSVEPYYDSLLSFDQLLYSDFAHSHSLLGTEDDVRNLTLDDVKNFYATYYVPNNAVLCVTGYFDKPESQRARRQVFRDHSSRARTSVLGFEPLVLPKRQVVRTFEDTLASAPAFHLGSASLPCLNDFYTLAIIDYILFRGRSSRITRRLRTETTRSPIKLSGGIEKRGDRAVYKIFVVANNEPWPSRCQSAIFAELDKLKIVVISEAELAKFKNLLQEGFLWRLSSTKDTGAFPERGLLHA